MAGAQWREAKSEEQSGKRKKGEWRNNAPTERGGYNPIEHVL
jgi:hypothetical protein